MVQPFYKDEYGALYCGDTKEILSSFDEPIVQMAITSPPYWAQRDYEKEGQLGQEPSFKEFVHNLADYFDYVSRAIKEDGTLWVNLDDTYYGSGKGQGGQGAASRKQVTNKGSFYRSNKGNLHSDLENASKFKKLREAKYKSMCLIPERFAIEMVDNHEWILRNDLVWLKPNAMTESCKDRFTLDYESLFFFSKQGKYFFNQQLEPYTAPMNRWGGSKLEADGVSEWDEGTGQTSYRKRNLRPNPKGRNKRSVWSINTQPIKGLNHFAKFPEALITTPILAGSDEGHVVLDPFFGSGTTGVVCEKLNRKWVGIELNEKYCQEAIDRIMKERNKNV